MKYTYSDDEDIFSDGLPPATRRSNRARAADEESSDAPGYSASGRPIRSRAAGGAYGESLFATNDDDGGERRTRMSNRVNGYADYKFGDSDESPSEEEEAQSGDEWQGGDEGEENDFDEEDDDDGDLSGDESVVNGNPPSLLVQLRYGKGKEKVKTESSRPPGESSEKEVAQAVVPSIMPDASAHADVQKTETHNVPPPSEMPESNGTG